jgi:hypothetical protein
LIGSRYESAKAAKVRKIVRELLKSECGANAPGGGGFQSGNTCGSLKGTGSSEASRIVEDEWDDVDRMDGFVRLISERESFVKQMHEEYPDMGDEMVEAVDRLRIKETQRVKKEISEGIAAVKEMIASPETLTYTVPKRFQTRSFANADAVDDAVEAYFNNTATSPLNSVKEAKKLNAQVADLIVEHNIIAKPVMQIRREKIDDYLSGEQLQPIVEGVAKEVKKLNGLEVAKSYRREDLFAFPKASLFSSELIKSDCGANAPGGGGFQTGNTCATGEAGTQTQKRPQPVVGKPKPVTDAEFREMQIQWTKKRATKIESQIQAAKQAVAEKEANMPMYGRADRQTYRELREAEASLRRAAGHRRQRGPDSGRRLRGQSGPARQLAGSDADRLR